MQNAIHDFVTNNEYLAAEVAKSSVTDTQNTADVSETVAATIATIEQGQAALKELVAQDKQKMLDAIEDPALRTLYTTLIENVDTLMNVHDGIFKHETQKMENNAIVLSDEKYKAHKPKLEDMSATIRHAHSDIYQFVKEEGYTDAQIADIKAKDNAVKAINLHSSVSAVATLGLVMTFGFAASSAVQVIAPKLDDASQKNTVTVTEAMEKTPVSAGLAITFAAATALAGAGMAYTGNKKSKAIKAWTQGG